MDQGMSNENSKTTEPKQAATDSQRTTCNLDPTWKSTTSQTSQKSLKETSNEYRHGKKHPDFSSDSNK